MPLTVNIHTLGCKVNQYESEAIAEALEKEGFVVENEKHPCDIYIINTCTVTAESDRKSRQMIRRAIKENPNARIIVTGCLAQTDPKNLAAICGVDYICGSRNKLSCVNAAISLSEKKNKRAVIDVVPNDALGFEKMCIHKFPRTRAYIKIEDGCESRCTYCTIPKARGKICSKAPEDVLSELKALIDDGCREAVLTGIETASYGIDLESYRLADLLCDADRISCGKTRLRLGSLDPSLIKAPFVEKIAALPSVAPHFHLSMQSGCDRVLANMKRKYNAKMALCGIELLRKNMPEVQFTTDIICGFPGETEEDFLDTLEFIKKVEFLDAHIFTYSKRPGTPAAQMQNQISPDVARARTVRLIEEQKKITKQILSRQIGKVFPVLFETYKDGVASGHTPSFIEVRVKSKEELHSQIRNVRIDGECGSYAEGTLVD